MADMPNRKPDDDGGGHDVSDEVLAALRSLAADLMPLIEWPAGARELKHAYQTGIWLEQVGKDAEKVAPGECYRLDPMSHTEVWKRFGNVPGSDKRTVTDMVGGRFLDGWINPPRSELPENDRETWPLDKKEGKPQDPWSAETRVTLRRNSDGQLLVWVARYGDLKAIGGAIDLFARECRQHPPGHVPMFTLSSVLSGKNFQALLVPTGDWTSFGEGLSLPANPARLQRAREELKRICEKYDAPKVIPLASAKATKGKAANSKAERGAMDDEIPF